MGRPSFEILERAAKTYMIVNDCKFTKNKISRLKFKSKQLSAIQISNSSKTGITTQCEQALSLCQH